MIQPNSDSNEIKTNETVKSNFFTVLFTSFCTIFLAELGDKTQIATLMLSAQSGKPITIFIAAALALICTSLLGVLIGRWIANNMPRKAFTIGSGLIMLSFGIYLVSQSIFDYLQN